MPTGYCTVEDVRWALQESELSGSLADDNNEAVVRAIAAQTEWVDRTIKRHWYVPAGLEEDTHDLIPTVPKSRDDEESIPTGGAHIVGEPVTPKTWQGSYTRVTLARREASAITKLLVRTPDGYEDWVASDEYTGGTWPEALGDDYYLRTDSGISQVYIDASNLLNEDGEPLIDGYAGAVYVEFDYGEEGIPQNVRRAIAFRALGELLIDDESALGIPDNGQLVNPETKKQAMEAKAEELLDEVYTSG